jgi:Peptidase family C78
MDVIDLCSSYSDADDDDAIPQSRPPSTRLPASAQYPIVHIEDDNDKDITVMKSTDGQSINAVSAEPLKACIMNPYLHRAKRKIAPSSTDDTPTCTDTSNNSACRNIQPVVAAVAFPHNKDTAIATNGIVPLLLKYCSNDNDSDNSQPTVVVVSTTSSSSSGMLHIQQKDKWSCGYRNLQMLLSAILPELSSQPPPLLHQQQQQQQWFCLPSLYDIQVSLEELWSRGYDRMGAEHYHYRIKNQRQWIGAVEVANYLSYQYRIDTTVIEFIVCHESRSLLSSFCRSYFTKQSPTQHVSTCPYCTDFNDLDASTVYSVSTWTMAQDILQSIEHGTLSSGMNTNVRNMNDNIVVPTCTCPTLPLYLQWNGHSVTIIGMELHDNHLLILDPKCNGSNIKKALLQTPPPPPQQQQRPLLPSVLRLSISDLIHKDCQIIVTSTAKTLSQVQLEHIQRNNIPSIIAANDAVTKLRRIQQQHR